MLSPNNSYSAAILSHNTTDYTILLRLGLSNAERMPKFHNHISLLRVSETMTLVIADLSIIVSEKTGIIFHEPPQSL